MVKMLAVFKIFNVKKKPRAVDLTQILDELENKRAEKNDSALFFYGKV